MNLRGLITSLGAGGSLIAAALCAAVLAGGLLAFRGGVDDPGRARAGDVTVPGATAFAAKSRPGPREVAASSATERRAAARRERPASRRERPASRRVAPSRRTTPAPVSAPPAAGPPAGGDDNSASTGEDAGGGSGPAAPAPPPAEGEQAGTVRRTVQQTREAVEPVVEAVPAPAVNEVADTIEQGAGTVDDTVTGLLPR